MSEWLPPKRRRVFLKSLKTILLTDDDDVLRQMLARILTDGGFRVLLAACARDALVLSESHEGSIEVLLSDIEMPGITGIELATRLQIQRPELKILLMSGLASGSVVLSDGWDFPPKPFISSLLFEEIRLLLNLAPAAKATDHLRGMG